MVKKLENPVPLKHVCLPEMVEKEIVNYIKRENIQCGDVLPSEKQFSEFFGVGRASIREGVARLRSAGLVKSVQGLGIVLNNISLDNYFQSIMNSDLGHFLHMTREEISQLIEVRALIEQNACTKYLKVGSPNELNRVYDCLQLLRSDAKTEDEVRFRVHDVDFHKAIVELGHNKIMDYFYSFIRIPSLREIEVLFTHENFSKIQKWHEEIYSALVNKDNNVISLLKEHLNYLFSESNIIEF